MILIDVNVVVAAFRPGHSHHAQVRPWFDRIVNGAEDFTVPDVVWSGFVGLVTNRRVFQDPTSVGDAFEFVRAVRAASTHRVMVPSERHLDLFEQLCIEGQAVGDLVPDAYLAALAMDQGAGIATLDRDFRRFDGLRMVSPTA